MNAVDQDGLTALDYTQSWVASKRILYDLIREYRRSRLHDLFGGQFGSWQHAATLAAVQELLSTQD